MELVEMYVLIVTFNGSALPVLASKNREALIGRAREWEGEEGEQLDWVTHDDALASHSKVNELRSYRIDPVIVI